MAIGGEGFVDVYLALERERIDWDHAEVAAWISDAWGLPENIAADIRGHHGEKVPNYEVLAPVLLVALLREDPDNSGVDEMITQARETYGIPEKKMTAIIEPGFERAAELARMIV
jgi:HD-like signal output (HDOD) protein